jgi:membrane protease YdiL (CAAX protease family)
VTSLFFALIHITHGLALHSVGDAISNVVAWRCGPPVARPLVWQTGADLQFWLALAVAIILALTAAWAFRRIEAVKKWAS